MGKAKFFPGEVCNMVTLGLRAFLLCVLGPTVRAQSRCQLAQVRRADGSYDLGGCNELRLHGERIGDEGASRLAEALAADSARVALLDLWSNGIGPKGAAALAGALRRNKSVQKLYLNENAIGGEGAAALASALDGGSRVSTLWLSRCRLGDSGAQALARVLRRGRVRLEQLDLWENEIGAAGGIALARALSSNRMLRTLELRGNPAMGDETARAFAELMPKNFALSTLDLLSTGVSESGRAALVGGLKVSRANPYLLLYADGLPHLQATSWQQKGQADAP